MINRTGIQRATRVGVKARLALAGPTGSGKTWTALDLARAFAEDKGVLLIDTEHGEARTYADEYEFDEFIWQPPYDPRELIDFLKTNAGQYGCVIIDSLTHFYNGEGGLLNIVDAGAARAGGNSFAGWKIATPIQNEMVDVLKGVPCHLIVTMRSKMEYILQTNAKGRQEPKKVGMAPIQREGFEYEMTFIAELDLEHNLAVTKTRYSGINGKVYRPLHQRELADQLMEWLATAKPDDPAPPPPPPATPPVAPAVSPPPTPSPASPPSEPHSFAAQAAKHNAAVPGEAERKLFPAPTAAARPPAPPASMAPDPAPVRPATTNTHWVDTLRLINKVPLAKRVGLLKDFDLPPTPTNAELRELPDDKGLALFRAVEMFVDHPPK